MIGGGSFGSAMARIAAQGVCAHPEVFHKEILWWIRREELVKEINEKHTNTQYLGGACSLPENLIAMTDLRKAADGATVCIMALPGEFVADSLSVLNEVLAPDAVVVSLIKSLKIKDGAPLPYTEFMKKSLSGRGMAALMGPNLYKDMARDEFAEATIGCDQEHWWSVMKQLFGIPTFSVQMHKDVIGVEMCGCLKNTITISCGIGKGLGYGQNVQAAIMRHGLLEIGRFLKEFFNVETDILFEACGFGDIVLSCTAGRGQMLAKAFVEHKGQRSWVDLEDELCGGMKLPDHKNVAAVYELFSKQPDGLAQYPLLATTYEIAFKGMAPDKIIEALTADQRRPAKRAKNEN